MNAIRIFLTTTLILLLVNSMPAMAEDIDIYSGSTSNSAPNLMFVVDNPSSQNNNASACTYWDGTSPSNNNKALGQDQCALANIVHGLATKADGSAVINLGITTVAGIYLKLTPIDDHPYTGTYAVPVGTTNRQAFILAVKAITQAAGKSGQGSELQETWAYYTGGNGGASGTGILSGTTYTGTNATTGCQKNYVIYLSNVDNANASHPQEWSATELTRLTESINNAVANGTITSAEGTTLKTKLPNMPAPIGDPGEGREWARFMKTVDINTTAAGAGSQTVITYSVATGFTAVPPAAITHEMENYIKAVSSYGGGKYFPAGDDSSVLTSSILKILNEVQAVNSVFSSSSLPVSVNAQGTYLNQIYMGMFRPDPAGNPRWVGNMKQYHFVATRDPVTHLISLSLSDSIDASAINPATGFITPDAISYWTCGGAAANLHKRACSPVADPASGFWANNPQSSGGAYDLPDGELVEKGGAAQVMRLANLTADYTTVAGTASNPRKLYSYCPGASCAAVQAALSNSGNAFATTNGNITATMFGASSSVFVSSIVRTGTSALVTTSGAHGYSTGNSVTISGATQTEYNVTQNITVNSANTFTITGLPDYPTTPSAGAYTASLHNAAAQAISTITRSSSSTATGRNTETATVTTAAAHGYSTGNSVQITGASPTDYNGIKTITVTSATQFTYPIAVYPTATAANTYKAVIHPYSRMLSSITKSGSTATATTSVAHGFHTGQVVTIAGTGQAVYDGAKTITVTSTTQFTFGGVTGNPGAITAGATAAPSTTPVVLSGLSRTGTTVAATATATGATASAFANGDTLDITLNTGTAANESAYVVSGALISCSGTCTTFTYPITVTPALSASGTMQVGLSAGAVTIPAASIARSGATATVTGVANAFVTGDSVDIATSGAVFANESAYTGTWTITCPVACGTAFTFGPVTLSPATPATGARITVYQGATPPAKDPLINWVRGEDNFGDELGPGGGVTVRPSFHGDVLHSRPVVINYGGSTGVVVFYGANDGVYRAVNGNQTNPAGSTLPAPGSELWGFIPSEFFGRLERQRSNSPVLSLPTTPSGIIPAPLKKDYFADGSTGIYQLVNSNGTTAAAYIYLAMRRGGRLIYALDVSTPTSPQFLWKIDPTGITHPSTVANPSGFTASADYAELGQTWSAPKVASVEGYANPVLIFGAGYDTAEDTEPPGANTMGRGIFVVDAVTGALVWSATQQPTGATACSGTSTRATCLVAGMDYSIPADITLVDRDSNGKIDRLYAVDVGGNVWRVDLQPTAAHKTPDFWQVSKLAELGCTGGVCANGPPRTTPRKFFYPADVVPTSSFDALIVGQGDREHPLFLDASVTIRNRIYMLRDLHTGNDGCAPSCPTPIVRAKLFDATTATYSINAPSTDGTTPNLGYYIKLGDGEKVVNAPLTAAGYTYIGTNQPTAALTCSANLGIARGYRLDPLGGTYTSTIFAGGGLPPSPVAGVVSVTVAGEATPSLVPFVIGGGGDPGCVGADCASALGGSKPTINVPTSRTRTYWYRDH